MKALVESALLIGVGVLDIKQLEHCNKELRLLKRL